MRKIVKGKEKQRKHWMEKRVYQETERDRNLGFRIHRQWLIMSRERIDVTRDWDAVRTHEAVSFQTVCVKSRSSGGVSKEVRVR